MYKLSKNSIRNIEGCDPRLIETSGLAIQITLVDFGHGPDSGLRTDERQHELYLDNKSGADGYENRSYHQADPVDGYAKALDFFAFVNGKASWAPEHLAMVAAAHLQAASMLGYPVEWGGLWRRKKGGIYGWDMPHIQLISEV